MTYGSTQGDFSGSPLFHFPSPPPLPSSFLPPSPLGGGGEGGEGGTENRKTGEPENQKSPCVDP